MTETTERPDAIATGLTEPAPSVPAPGRVGATEIGYLFALVGAVLFSTKSIAIKLAYTEPVDAATLLTLRMIAALPIYAVIAAFAVRDRRARNLPLPGWPALVQAAAVGALGYWFASYTDFLGLEFISAQFERLILFTYPLFVVVFGAMMFGEPVRLKTLAAIAVSYLGLVVIFAEKLNLAGSAVAIGAALVLCAAVAFAFYQLLARRVMAAMGPGLFTCVAMSGAALAVFATFLVGHPAGDLVVSRRVLAITAYLAIGATVLPSFFMNAALHRIPARANATISTLSPVITILLAVAILGERLTPLDIAGTILVLLGVGWFTLAGRGG